MRRITRRRRQDRQPQAPRGDLPGAPGASFAERLAALDLADAELKSSEDEDPAGGDRSSARAHTRSATSSTSSPELEANVAPDEEIA